MRNYCMHALVWAFLGSIVMGIGCAWYASARTPEPTFKPDAKTWSVPITVWAHDFHEATGTAMEMWNHAAGCMIFTVADRADLAMVQVNPDNWPCEKPFEFPIGDEAAAAYLCSVNRAEIHVSRPGGLRTQLAIMLHELGEVLGLQHDPEPHSPMYGGATEVAAQRFLHPSWADGEAVGERYCKP